MSGGPYYLGLVLVSPPGSRGCPLSFTTLNVTMENATVDPWRWVRRAKSPGVTATALYRGQEVSTTGETVDKTAVVPSSPRILSIPRRAVPREGQPEAAGRYSLLSFRL